MSEPDATSEVRRSWDAVAGGWEQHRERVFNGFRHVSEWLIAQVGTANLYLGGTSLLIVVSVTMDTVAQIQSHLIAHQYEGLIKKARLRGRRG